MLIAKKTFKNIYVYKIKLKIFHGKNKVGVYKIVIKVNNKIL